MIGIKNTGSNAIPLTVSNELSYPNIETLFFDPKDFIAEGTPQSSIRFKKAIPTNDNYIYAPANRNLLNQTAIQPIFATPNSFTFSANKLYEFEGFLTTFFDVQTFIDFGMLGATTSCVDVNYIIFASVNGNPYLFASESQTFESTRVFTLYNGFRNTRIYVKGSFKTTTNGTIIPAIGFDTGSQYVNIKKGSFIKFKEIML